MRSKIFFALFLFLLGSIFAIAQEPPHLRGWKRVDEQAENRHMNFDEPNIPISALQRPLLIADEITTLNAIIPDFQANENAGPNGAPQYAPSISTDGSGNFIMAWADERNGDSGIYAQRYSSDGIALGNNFRVTNTTKKAQSSPDIKLWNNRIYNTWTDNHVGGTGYDIWANILDWDTPVGISDEVNDRLPSAYILNQNYPNPFNPSTKISYSISKPGFVILKIYDMLGWEIQTLVNEFQLVDTYTVNFDAKALSSGIYFYKLHVGIAFLETKKMMFLR